mmetsp:Transcript_40458/g.114582  ORF Transcript_40458/g.114582 Transcript_40458/m.114582 type:complete len:207 (-) Transcript_40458:390-1010(-)
MGLRRLVVDVAVLPVVNRVLLLVLIAVGVSLLGMFVVGVLLTSATRMLFVTRQLLRCLRQGLGALGAKRVACPLEAPLQDPLCLLGRARAFALQNFGAHGMRHGQLLARQNAAASGKAVAGSLDGLELLLVGKRELLDAAAALVEDLRAGCEASRLPDLCTLADAVFETEGEVAEAPAARTGVRGRHVARRRFRLVRFARGSGRRV